MEEPDALVVARFRANRWHEEKRLPRTARALRFSADGATVAWVQDDLDGTGIVPHGYVQHLTDTEPTALGALGLRAHEAMGLAVAPDGRVVFLNAAGELVDSTSHQVLNRGSQILFDEKGEPAYLDVKGCLFAPSLAVNGSPCDPALRPVDYLHGLLLARDNRGLIEIRTDSSLRVPLTDVVDARVRRHGEAVVVRRVDDHGKPAESVVLMHPDEALREATRGAVIISATFDSDGGLLVIRRSVRKDIYELLLAHAPDEFGGEALSGDAVRFTPVHLQESPVPGLEQKSVRALFVAR